jgi:fumarate reductase flavoprotein subunit
MKKMISTALLLVLVLAGCSSAPKVYNNGTYEGTGEGKKGPVVVAVTFENDKITTVEVTAQEETPEIATLVFESLPAQIVELQGTEGVDTYAGATYTRDAIITAVEQAIEQAKIK